MDAIFELVGQRQEFTRWVLIGTLIVIRILPITFITPFLGGKLVPNETRMGLAVGLAVLTFGHAESYLSGTLSLNPVVFLVLMLKELFIGYAVAFVSTLIFYAMEIGGRMLDVMRGSSMAEVQVPELSLRASPLGDFKFHLLLVVYMAMDGHIRFIDALAESYRLVPLDAWPHFTGGFATWVDEILHYTSSLFGIAFALVFPGLFAAFMTDVVFGMLNRVAPQLNAYFMAMGIKALAGIAMMFFSLSLMIKMMGVHAADSLIFLQRLVNLMG
jgi:flagellar biosynthetic protein FliR